MPEERYLSPVDQTAGTLEINLGKQDNSVVTQENKRPTTSARPAAD